MSTTIGKYIKKKKNWSEQEVSQQINDFLDRLNPPSSVRDDLFQEAWVFFLESKSKTPNVGAKISKLWNKAREREDYGDTLTILSENKNSA